MGRALFVGGKVGMKAPVVQIKGISISTIAEGSVVKINENGVPAEFYIAKHNYEQTLNGSGRTLLVRKNCYDARKWHSSDVDEYSTSAIDSWLNSTYKALLDENVQTAIGTTRFYYHPSDDFSDPEPLTRSVFLLSLAELGNPSIYSNKEGAELPIANVLQTAYRNNAASTQWTRSPFNNGSEYAWYFEGNGNADYQVCTNTYGSRPAFTLPSTAVFDEETLIFKGVAGNVDDGSDDSALPAGYTELAYIESSKSQYVNTGVNPTNKTRVVCDFQFTNTTSTQYLFCARGASSTSYANRFGLLLSSSGYFRSDFGTANANFSTGLSLGDRHVVDKNGCNCVIDETSVTNTDKTFESSYQLVLFAGNTAGTVGNKAAARIYSCQIYEDGTLVRDFVPCKDSSGNIGLYDKVNGQFYGDAAGGAFIAGSEVAA